MPEEFSPSNPSQPQRFLLFRMLFGKRALIWFGVVILFLSVVFYIVFHVWVESYFHHRVEALYGARSKNVVTGEDRLTELKKYWNTVVHFPDECYEKPITSYELTQMFKAIQFAEDTLRANKKWDYFQVLDRWKDRLNAANSMSKSDWEDFEKDLSEYEGFLAAGVEFAKQMERETHKHRPGVDFPILSDRYSCLHESLCMKLKAIALMREGRPQEAVEYLMRGLALFISNPYQNFGDYRAGLGHIDGIPPGLASLLDNAVSAIYDESALRDLLERLNHLEPYLFQNQKNRVNELILWEDLLNLRQHYNANADLSSGKKVSYYVGQLAETYYRKTDLQEILSTLYTDWMTGRKRTGYERERRMIQYSRYLLFPSASKDYLMLRSSSVRYANTYLSVEDRAGVRYDLLRLKIAAKLFYEDTGRNPTQTGDLVPSYFEKELKHRETGKPYVWLEGVPDEE